MSAISTYQTFLMVKSGSGYEKLVDISSIPDLIGEPQTIDVTTLSDDMTKFIAGIKQSDLKTFNCFYDHESYAKIKAMEGVEKDFAVWFGAASPAYGSAPDGHAGKFHFKGYISAGVSGGGVNEAVGMNIYIIPTTVITDETASD